MLIKMAGTTGNMMDSRSLTKLLGDCQSKANLTSSFLSKSKSQERFRGNKN